MTVKGLLKIIHKKEYYKVMRTRFDDFSTIFLVVMYLMVMRFGVNWSLVDCKFIVVISVLSMTFWFTVIKYFKQPKSV